MTYEEANRRTEQLRGELNRLAERVRELAEELENVAGELPIVLEDAPEDAAEHNCTICELCNYHTNDGRCLYIYGCVKGGSKL